MTSDVLPMMVAFALNILILGSFGWLVKAYWPMDKPPSPWNMILCCVVCSSVILLAADVLYTLGGIGLEMYSAVRAITARLLLAWAGIYSLGWHIRQRANGQ